MQRKIKIAQVIGNASLGGVASCVFNYYKYVDKDKVFFDFFTYGKSGFDEKIREICPDARIFYIPSLIKFYKSVPALTKIFKAEKYDIVHSHMTTLSYFVLKAAKKAKIPVRICHSHSAANKYADHKLIKDILKRFAPIHATHYMACGNAAAEYLFGKKSKDCYIMKNAIEPERFSATDSQKAKNQLGLSGNVAGFIGRFVYQKNLFFLLDAFALSIKDNKDLTLALVGDGEQKQKLINYANKMGISSRVKFFEPTKQPELFYSAFDCFLLPSKYEGLPVVAIEAQAMGTPCIFSNLITKECSFLPENKFLPLDCEKWASEISKISAKSGNFVDFLQKCGYDIRIEAQKLVEYYQKISKIGE